MFEKAEEIGDTNALNDLGALYESGIVNDEPNYKLVRYNFNTVNKSFNRHITHISKVQIKETHNLCLILD